MAGLATIPELLMDLLEKQCDAVEMAEVQFDCLCNAACKKDVTLTKDAAGDSFTVEPTELNSYAVGSTVSFYNDAGDIIGTAEVSGEGVENADGTFTYPITDCTVPEDQVANVVEVKPVLAVAAVSYQAVAVKSLSKLAVTSRTATKEG